jgi:hypothetical protein
MVSIKESDMSIPTSKVSYQEPRQLELCAALKLEDPNLHKSNQALNLVGENGHG